MQNVVSTSFEKLKVSQTLREFSLRNCQESLVRNVSGEDAIFVAGLVKQSPDVARYEGAAAGAEHRW